MGALVNGTFPSTLSFIVFHKHEVIAQESGMSGGVIESGKDDRRYFASNPLIGKEAWIAVRKQGCHFHNRKTHNAT